MATDVRLAVRSEPRGNGKTGLVAGLALCHLLGPEAELRGECYSAAVNRRQSALMFDEMVAIIEAVPEFAARGADPHAAASGADRGDGRARARARNTRRCRPMRGAVTVWRRPGGPMTRWRRPAIAGCSMRCAPRWASASGVSASSCRHRPRTTSIRCRN